MIEVAGMWELGYSAPLTEADLWRFPLRDFNVDRWLMAPVSGINVREVEEFPDVDSMLDSAEGEIVFVDEQGEVELSDFTHPQDVCYVFGKASYSPMMSRKAKSVRIATPQGKGLLWPHQAAVIVLRDRLLK